MQSLTVLLFSAFAAAVPLLSTATAVDAQVSATSTGLAAEATCVGCFEVPDIYDVVLKKGSDERLLDHILWATKIHLDMAKNATDVLFGLKRVYGKRSYLFQTYEETAKVMRKHPDIEKAERRVVSAPSTHEHLICLKKSDQGNQTSTAILTVTQWAETIHKQDQKTAPNDKYRGVLIPELIRKNKGCFVGSFSPSVLDHIRGYPEVGGVHKFTGVYTNWE